jgi:hypothetical protein
MSAITLRIPRPQPTSRRDFHQIGQDRNATTLRAFRIQLLDRHGTRDMQQPSISLSYFDLPMFAHQFDEDRGEGRPPKVYARMHADKHVSKLGIVTGVYASGGLEADIGIDSSITEDILDASTFLLKIEPVAQKLRIAAIVIDLPAQFRAPAGRKSHEADPREAVNLELSEALS